MIETAVRMGTGAGGTGTAAQTASARVRKAGRSVAVIDHRPFEAQLHHAAFQFVDSCLDVLHRQCRQSSEASGVVSPARAGS